MNGDCNDQGCIVTMKSSPAEKIRLMSSMFYGRRDVFARPWVQTEFAADGKPYLLEDRVGKRTFTVSRSSGDTWCVWNSGVERTPLCDTLSPDEWQRLYCLEPFMRQPITLAPGESREHVVRIAVSGL